MALAVSCASKSGICCGVLIGKGAELLSRAGAVHLVLEGSSHDTFNDAVMLVALRFKGAMNYVRSFKKVGTRISFHALAYTEDTVEGGILPRYGVHGIML